MGQHMTKSLQLKSPAFRNNAEIPERYTCDGENVHPPLQLSFSHPDVRTLALIMDNPSPPNGLFTHWLIWNIDPATAGIGEGAVPVNAVEGTNSAGTIGYTGPCPPAADPGSTPVHTRGTNTAGVFNYAENSALGEHRYRFQLYALDTWLTLPPGASREELEEAMRDHVVEQATLTGRYKRSKVKGESKKRRLL